MDTWILTAIGAAIGAIFGWLGVRSFARHARVKSLETPGGKRIAWPRSALPLMVTAPVEDHDLYFALEAAASFWNLAAGKMLFLIADQPDPATVFNRPGPGLLSVVRFPGAAGHTVVHYDEHGSVVAAPVGVDPGVPKDLLRRVLAHELGHVLALDHSLDPRNVMYPEALPGAFHLGEDDQVLLKTLYC